MPSFRVFEFITALSFSQKRKSHSRVIFFILAEFTVHTHKKIKLVVKYKDSKGG